MFKKWWALRHIGGGGWFPMKVTTIFGYPLCTIIYQAAGPYKTEEDCRYAIETDSRLK